MEQYNTFLHRSNRILRYPLHPETNELSIYIWRKIPNKLEKIFDTIFGPSYSQRILMKITQFYVVEMKEHENIYKFDAGF